LAAEKATPVGQAPFNLPLELLEVQGGDRSKACQSRQFCLERAASPLPRLNPIKQRLEVAALGDRSRESGELLL
jgi:hypothetical protein